MPGRRACLLWPGVGVWAFTGEYTACKRVSFGGPGHLMRGGPTPARRPPGCRPGSPPHRHSLAEDPPLPCGAGAAANSAGLRGPQPLGLQALCCRRPTASFRPGPRLAQRRRAARPGPQEHECALETLGLRGDGPQAWPWEHFGNPVPSPTALHWLLLFFQASPSLSLHPHAASGSFSSAACRVPTGVT